jgi:hypothetical protein
MSGNQEFAIMDDSAKLLEPAIYENKIVCRGAAYLTKVYFVPVLTSVSPSAVHPGKNITLTGKNFGYAQEGAQVLFSNGSACNVQSWSNTQIVCTVPITAQTGEVSVITKGGKSNGITVAISNNAPTVVYGSWPAITFNTNTAYTFSTLSSDADGYSDIKNIYIRVGEGVCFLARYQRDTNKLYLYDFIQGAYIGGFAPGSANTITTPQGTLYCAQTSVSPTGNNIYVNWSISFVSAYKGYKSVSGYVEDIFGAIADWLKFGDISIYSISYVSWQNLVGVSLSGNTLKKTTATGWGNSGAASSQSITADGRVEFTAIETNTYRMVGLAYSNPDANFTSIDYGIYPSADGYIRVYEKGVWKGKFTTYKTGDILFVERVGSTVYYKQNGTTVYKSATSSSGTMIVDAGLYTSGATIVDAKIFY